jgi:hypothetical protein
MKGHDAVPYCRWIYAGKSGVRDISYAEHMETPLTRMPRGGRTAFAFSSMRSGKLKLQAGSIGRRGGDQAVRGLDRRSMNCSIVMSRRS